MAGIYLSVCEFVAVHTDGTHTIVRGGIENWKLQSLPANLAFWVFVHVPSGAFARGKHPLSVRLVSPNGLAVANVEGEANIDDPATSTRVTVALVASVQEFGDFRVESTIGDVTGHTVLQVIHSPPSEAQ